MAEYELTTKVCTACDRLLSLVDFARDKRKNTGTAARCRSCERERNRAYYEKNREAVRLRVATTHKPRDIEEYRERLRIWRQKNAARYQAQRRAYREKNIIATRAADAAWKRRNRDRVRLWEIRYTAAHPEKVRKRRELYRAANKLRRAENFRRWASENPEKVRIIAARRRARMLSAAGNGWTEFDILAVLKAQRHRCAHCRNKLPAKFHRDHIIPLSKGGAHDRRNLQLLCAVCNLSKGARDPIDHARLLGLLI